MGISVRLAMNNHVYKFGDNIRVQENEGGIGVELTGVLADLRLLKWCIVLEEKLKKLHIQNDLDDRYVDDITVLPTVLPPGTKYKDDKLIICEDKIEEDNKVAGDIRTMKIIQEVSNKIDKNIRVTFDAPSYQNDGKVPILDLKVKYNESTRNIEYEFYKKNVASKFVTLKTSAMSSNVKFESLTQQ